MYSSEHKEQKIDDSNITKLYYGFNRVYFKECTGKTFTLNNKIHSFKSLSDEKSIKIVKQRRLPQTDLGIEYSHLLLPSMPCHDIEITNSDNETTNNKANGLISLSPVIKTKETDYSVNKNIIGYKSGVRSALICIENKEEECQWYRLKGCGNNDNGYFPFECIEDGQSPLIQIRGCCFKHTAFRELKMTNDIKQILNKYNIYSANESYGWYEYDIDKYCKKIIRTCAIFKTKGNKRFGDHLMNGLLKILPIIIDIENVSISEIYDLFPQIRKQQVQVDTKWKVMQSYLAVLCEIEIINLNLQNDGNDIKIALKKCIEINGDFKWLFGDGNDCKYKESLWRYQCDEYNKIISNIDDKDIINRLIIDIFYRLGFESGFIQKLLHLNNISWGTYNDSLGTHCNAHCNNYVILPYHEFIKHNFCLAPLDFDMAFYENEYIENMEEKQYTFDELIIMECNGNRGSLSGDPDISTGVHWKEDDDEYKYKDDEEKNKFDLINWALRDTLICSFDNAYNNKNNNDKYIFEWKENKQKLMYAIFNLALIATLDVVA